MSIELKRALYNISSLADLGHEVTSEDNFSIRIQSVLYIIMGTFLAGKGIIFRYGKETDEMLPLTHKGYERSGLPGSRLTKGHMSVCRKNEPVHLSQIKDFPDMPVLGALADAGLEILLPLWVGEELIGSIFLGGKFTGEPYSTDDFELLKVIANQTAVAISNHDLFISLSEQLDKNRRLYEEMRLIYHDTIQAFAAAIDAKDPYTKNHSHRVARYAVAIARELGWEETDIEGIYIAGFLHDVGKLIISTDLLNKKENLTEKELGELRRHPSLSYKIISNIKFPWKDVVTIIRHHHERLDGTGYPGALTSDDLSDGVKILTLADSFDAMTSERAYRNRMDLKSALEELKRCLGTQFDGRIVSAFYRVLEKEIKGLLPEPNILPHIDDDFDPSVISGLLEALNKELSA